MRSLYQQANYSKQYINYTSSEKWCLTTVCHMTRSKVKVKGMEFRNLRKWPILKSFSSADMHAIKRLMMNYDTPRPMVPAKAARN